MKKLSHWTDQLQRLYAKALEKYEKGEREHQKLFTRMEQEFLRANGLKTINLFDYAEDFIKSGEPDWNVALLLAAERRDYFLREQNGRWSKKTVEEEELPAREAKLAGIEWLPRMIAKARGFLTGEICEEIMFCCGGDRKFLKKQKTHPLDFLRIVRQHPEDKKVAQWLKAR